jgi:gliding motility-associated-like protein
MNKIKKYSFLFLFSLLSITISYSQIDTAFWFAAPWSSPDHTERHNIVMHISTFSAPQTTVYLRQPAAIAPNKYDTFFVIGPNTNFDYIFWRDKIAAGPPSTLTPNAGYDSLEVKPANTVLPYGFYISSTSNITVVYDVICQPPGFNNPETFSLKGQNGLGLEFVCPHQTIYRNRTLGNRGNTPSVIDQPKQQIVIVATQSNTVVWITPKCPVVGHPANITYSVLLPAAGSCYNVENVVQNTYVLGNNLSGSIVVANKPIAVTVSDDSINSVHSSPNAPGYSAWGGMGCFDLVGDQIVPVEVVGKDYIVNLGQLYKAGQLGVGHPGMKESAFIVATENFTQLTINDGVSIQTAFINKGDTYVDTLFQPLTYIKASKNVYVYHLSGIGCELGAAILPPLSCAGSKLVAFSRNTPQRFALNILCKNGSQSTFTLNASTTSITAANFTVVPGTAALVGGPFWGAQVNFVSTSLMPIGSYTIGNNSNEFALGVFDGNFTSGGLFHYMSSFLRKTVVKTQTLAPICVGQNSVVALTGTISGGSVSGLWTTNGSGSFGPYTSTNNIISTTYSFSVADTTLLSQNTSAINFTLTSTGDCTPVSNTISLIISQRPNISVGSGTILCKNNISPISLTGTVNFAINGLWSGGNGGVFGVPGSVTTYTPSQADLAANTITLSLLSQGPQAGCFNSVKSITVGFVNPPIVNLGTTPIVCTNTQSFILNGGIVGVTNTGIWTTNGTGLFIPNNAITTTTYQLSQSDLTQNQINFTLTSTNNSLCASESNTMQINIIPKPTVIVPADFTVCASAGAIFLTGNVLGSANTGSWSTMNGSGSFTQNPPTSASYVLSQNDTLVGNVTFILNSYGGNCPSVIDSVHINVLKRPVIEVNSGALGFCENAEIALTGTVTGYTNLGIWSSGGTGVFSPTNTALNGVYIPSPIDIANGNVVLTLTTLNPFQNCGSSKSFTGVFVKAPEGNFFPSAARCLGSPILFTNGSQPNGTSDLSYSWDFGDGSPGGSSTKDPIYTYTNTGQYIVTLTVTGVSALGVSCPDTISKSFQIKALPVADFTITPACQNLPTIFTNISFTPPQTEPIFKWEWSFGDGTTTLTGLPTFTLVHTYTSSISYNAILTVTTIAGCVSDPKIKPINILPEPEAEFGMTNNPTVVEDPVYFSDFTSPTGNIVSWFWQFGDEGSAEGNAPVHRYIQAGVYNVTLTVTDLAGCRDTLSKSIEVSLLPQVPTGFSPNNDGQNDLLVVKGGPFAVLTFRVYNNWGELLFETQNQSIGWDGKFKGVDQPVGVYLWTLTVDMYNNRQVKRNGDITLIR